jgi:photosystem II stability/assembly factor-like uncharacterized protein
VRRRFAGLLAALFTAALAAPAPAVEARRTLGVDPKEPRRVLLWQEGVGLFSSADAGETWSKLAVSARSVARVAYGEGNVILLATDDGLLVSLDGGRLFARPEGVPDVGRWVDVAQAGKALFAISENGVFRSVDGGRTFRSAGVPGRAFHLFRIRTSPRFPEQVVLVSATLIHRSDDGGETWRRIPAAPDFDYGSLVWAAGDPPSVLAGNGKGVFRSGDGGASWKAFPNAPSFVRGLWAPDPATDKYLLASTLPQSGDESWSGRAPEKALYRTLDGGKAWSANLSPDGGVVLEVAFAPGRTEALYVTTDRGGVYRSGNKGDSWREISPPAK